MAKDSLPLYVRIAERILQDFRSSGDEPETRLPPELALAERYKVSRTTIREALRQLERDGATSSRHGIGTFMINDRNRLVYPVDVLVGYSSVFKGPGASTVLLNCTEMDSTPEQVEKFGWPRGKVVLLERLRVINGNVVAYSIDNAPTSYLGGVVDTEALVQSFFGALERAGYKPYRATSSLRALPSPRHVVKYMPSCKKGAVMFSEELVYDRADRVIAVSKDYLDTRFFNFQVERRVVDSGAMPNRPSLGGA